jgi:Arm DNA-binding domain
MWTVGKLTDVQVRAAGAGTLGDGGGLYLAVKRRTAGLTRSWLFRYAVGGRSHWIGLGAYPDISLQRARQKTQECRRQLCDGGLTRSSTSATSGTRCVSSTPSTCRRLPNAPPPTLQVTKLAGGAGVPVSIGLAP